MAQTQAPEECAIIIGDDDDVLELVSVLAPRITGNDLERHSIPPGQALPALDVLEAAVVAVLALFLRLTVRPHEAVALARGDDRAALAPVAAAVGQPGPQCFQQEDPFPRILRANIELVQRLQSGTIERRVLDARLR